MSCKKFTSIILVSVIGMLSAASDVAAQGLPVDTGSQWPIGLIFIGAVVLGCALAYGIMRNRTRTSSEKRLTEEVTAERYQRNDEG